MDKRCYCGKTVRLPWGRRTRCPSCGRVHSRNAYGNGSGVARADVPWLKPFKRGLTAHAVRWRYGPKDLERMRWGFVPQDMNEKWVAYFDGEEIHAFRSWTARHMLSFHLTSRGIDRVCTRPGASLKLARWFVTVLLLGRKDPDEAEWRRIEAIGRRNTRIYERRLERARAKGAK